jgi:hypothetical protein
LYLNISVFSLEPLLTCPTLRSLFLHNCIIIEGINFLSQCVHLEDLFIESVSKVGEIITAISKLKNLESLTISKQSQITRVPRLKDCTGLKRLAFRNCSNMSDISELKKCPFITQYGMRSCGDVIDFTPLSSLINLERLVLTINLFNFIPITREIDTRLLFPCSKLNTILIEGFSLNDASSFKNLLSLKELTLGSINSEVQIPQLPDIGILNKNQKLSGLEKFVFYGSPLHDLSDFKMTEELKIIEIGGCSKLKNINFITKCKKLTKVNIFNCSKLSNIILPNSPSLQEIKINDTRIEKLSFLYNYLSLTSLSISGVAFSSLENLQSCPNLTTLNLSSTSINDINFLADLTRLEDLNLDKCSQIRTFSALRYCDKLKKLSLKETLINHPGHFELLPNLEILDISGCLNIYLSDSADTFPSLIELRINKCSDISLSCFRYSQTIRRIFAENTYVYDLELFIRRAPESLQMLKTINTKYVRYGKKMIEKKSV